MINNSLFKVDVPKGWHPVINKYERLDFWRLQRRRCMEGYWVAGKWMPGELYYYVNFHHINIEKGSYKGLGLPFLRDIDWLLFYVYTEAIGFSGFSGDDKYTCFRPVKDYEAGLITEEEIKIDHCTISGIFQEDRFNSLKKSDGSFKKYVDAREYLPKIHSGHLGKPLYFNDAKHLMNMSSRGWGKSMSASGLISHNWLFDGCHDYDAYISSKTEKKPLKSETNVGAIDAKYSGDLLAKVQTALENLPDSHTIADGRFVKSYPSLLMKEYSGSFLPSKTVTAKDSESTINHRTLQDNPLVFNGTRPNRSFIDEVGFVSVLLEAWEAMTATSAAEEVKRHTIYGMGTGGLTAGGAAMYAHEIFYNPEAYNCISFDDIWENKGKIGFFLPATYALNKYKEGPNLITNEERALKSIEAEREAAKKSPTRTKLMGTIINKPLVPSEIFLRLEGSFFPTPELKSRLADVESRLVNKDFSYKYELDLIDGKVIPRASNKIPIREFPLPKGFSMDAPVECWELPKRLADGSIPYGRYISGWDVIDHDGNEDVTQSLQSIWILDTWTDRIVAEYTARTYLVEDYYEQARRLLILYNAICNYEMNKKGPYAHFKNKNSLHLLCETPEILKNQNLVKGSSVGNKSLGTNTNEEVTMFGLREILSWLESQAYDEDDGVRNIDTINSTGLLKELISYSKDINTDRVSGLIMTMILRSDRKRMTDISKSNSIKSITSDPKWRKPFGGNRNKGILYTGNGLPITR